MASRVGTWRFLLTKGEKCERALCKLVGEFLIILFVFHVKCNRDLGTD